MATIFLFSAAPANLSDAQSEPIAQFLGISNGLIRKIAHFITFALLGASWYYYLRHYGRYTPAFTFFASLAFTTIYAFLDEFHQIFVPGRTGLISDVLIDALAGFTGVTIFALIYYLTCTPAQKTARRQQINQIWQNNKKLIKKLRRTNDK
jgi:VanZ family protein